MDARCALLQGSNALRWSATPHPPPPPHPHHHLPDEVGDVLHFGAVIFQRISALILLPSDLYLSRTLLPAHIAPEIGILSASLLRTTEASKAWAGWPMGTVPHNTLISSFPSSTFRVAPHCMGPAIFEDTQQTEPENSLWDQPTPSQPWEGIFGVATG